MPKSTAFATEMGARPQPIDLGPAPGAKAACVAVDPQVRARARRRSGQGEGQRRQGPHHAEDVRELVKAVMAGGVRPAAAPARRRGTGPRTHPAGVAAGRLRQVRADRAQGPVAHQEDQRPGAARNWVMIPHVTNHDDADITDLEAFRVQLNNENDKSKAAEADDARVPDQGLRRGTEEVPRFQRPMTPRATRSSARTTSTSASRPTRRTAWWCRSSRTPTRRAFSI